MFIDERLANTQFPLPAIRKVNRAKHETAISLGLGELKNFPVDARLLKAMEHAITNGGTSYTDNAGLPELRRAIAEKQQRSDGFAYTAAHVVVTIGVQNALYATIKTLVKLGARRVLIPEINFGIYHKIPADFGLEVITYPLTPDFGIDFDQLFSLLEPDDLLLINSPANPTGRVFTESEQKLLASGLKNILTRGYVISDEIYEQLVYEGEAAKSFAAFFDRTIVLNGISKSGAAAGLRVGWIITRNEKLAQAFTSNNATVISCPPTINQYAAIPVVNGETQQSIAGYNRVLKKNRDLAAHYLITQNIPFVNPTGSFYIFPELGNHIRMSVNDFCLHAAKAADGVVVIPGEAFGAPNHIRISLASNQMNEGMARLVNFLEQAIK
ncbi:MAG: pyridoxal phosphate-dependent aminotransferase [Salinivirgaceae bacterium]